MPFCMVYSSNKAMCFKGPQILLILHCGLSIEWVSSFLSSLVQALLTSVSNHCNSLFSGFYWMVWFSQREKNPSTHPPHTHTHNKLINDSSSP